MEKLKFIPLSVPNLRGNELNYVIDAMEKEWVSTGGNYILDFEKKIAEFVNQDNAVACQSGTAGIHLALDVLCIGTGDEVIVPTLTFIAAVNPVRYLGAEPIFMDCDDSLNMDLDKLEEFIESECYFIDEKLINKKTKKHIKAIIIVHIFGNMANMIRIKAIGDKYNLKIIEDSTEALGTFYIDGELDGKYAGTIADIGVYSFNGNKIITTGGGGAIVAKSPDILKKIKHLSTQAKSDELYYMHDEIGYNYRMTNIQAAIGLGQIEQLDEFINIKKRNYDLYNEELKEVNGLRLLKFDENINPNYWFYSIVIEEDYGKSRDELLNELLGYNIQTRPIWGLVSNQKPYINNQTYRIEKAEYYRDRVLNIPCSTNLLKEEILYVCEVLKKLKG